jgi:hypothetical protein
LKREVERGSSFSSVVGGRGEPRAVGGAVTSCAKDLSRAACCDLRDARVVLIC